MMLPHGPGPQARTTKGWRAPKGGSIAASCIKFCSRSALRAIGVYQWRRNQRHGQGINRPA